MALPIIGWTLSGFLWSIGTAIVGGLFKFFASKLGELLTLFGMGTLAMYGINVFFGYIVDDITYIAEGIASIDTGGPLDNSINVLEIMAYIGFFDALNIIFTGFFLSIVLVNTRVAIGWNNKNNL